MKDSLTVLQVQIVTAKEALQKLNQQENEYVEDVCAIIAMQLATQRHAAVLLVQMLIRVK